MNHPLMGSFSFHIEIHIRNRHNSNLNPFTITGHSDEVTEWPDGLSSRMGRLRARSSRGGLPH